MIGQYAALIFETAAFKQYTPDGLALINAYDNLVYLEQDFMGLFKYKKEFKNRAYFLVIYDSYMYATDYFAAYVNTTQPDLLNVDKFVSSAIWGPAHELGHIHQTHPGLKWVGMTEVTNKYTLYVCSNRIRQYW